MLVGLPDPRYAEPVIGERLRSLYGPWLGDKTAAELQRLLEAIRPRLPARPAPAEWFDQRDTVLISYGDTFRAPDRPSRRYVASRSATW